MNRVNTFNLGVVFWPGAYAGGGGGGSDEKTLVLATDSTQIIADRVLLTYTARKIRLRLTGMSCYCPAPILGS